MSMFAVSGPNVGRPAESAGVGLSLALTFASRASLAREEATYYVRDAAGDVVGRADSDGSGAVSVFGRAALAAARNQLDRASAREEATVSRADGRPGSPRRPSKEDSMATTSSKPGASPAEDLAAQVKHISAKQAACEVLKQAKEPLKADEIARRVLKTKGVALGGKTPEATIAAMLAVENKKPDGLFVRTDKATYALREQQKATPSRRSSQRREATVGAGEGGDV